MPVLIRPSERICLLLPVIMHKVVVVAAGITSEAISNAAYDVVVSVAAASIVHVTVESVVVTFEGGLSGLEQRKPHDAYNEKGRRRHRLN